MCDYEYKKYEVQKPRKRLVLTDGNTMSVQANDFTYCSPRDNVGPYTEVEVGFPSFYSALLEPYKENFPGSSFQESVFPYVPVDVVLRLIEEHGGNTTPSHLPPFVEEK